MGSGEVGFLIKKTLLNDFDVSMLDDTYEGILWLKLIHKQGGDSIVCCVCYLPPINSTRNVDSSEFLDNLMCQMQEFVDQSLFYLCGDFNARISNFDDFISGVDFIPDRHIVDYNSNKHGDDLVEFLINSYCCVLNGRNNTSNDFTFIGLQGASVVDYCIVPYEKLNLFDSFEVIRMSDKLNDLNLFDTFDNLTSMPDHSILSWKIVLHNLEVNECESWDTYKSSYTCFDRKSTTDSFLCGCQADIDKIIDQLESMTGTQESVNEIYNDFNKVLKTEMDKKLKHKQIHN